jgi:hypothetical protein
VGSRRKLYREQASVKRWNDTVKAPLLCSAEGDNRLSNRKSPSGILFGEDDAVSSSHVIARARLNGHKGRPEGVAGRNECACRAKSILLRSGDRFTPA